MSIRPAAPADIPAIVALGERMHAEAPNFQGWAFDREKVAALVAGLINGGGCALVAELDGELCGGVLGMCTEHWFSRERVASDLALFVAPGRRGGSLAVRLVMGFKAWALAMGAREVHMGVSTGVHPEATARLFEACGLRHTGLTFSETLKGA